MYRLPGRPQKDFQNQSSIPPRKAARLEQKQCDSYMMYIE